MTRHVAIWALTVALIFFLCQGGVSGIIGKRRQQGTSDKSLGDGDLQQTVGFRGARVEDGPVPEGRSVEDEIEDASKGSRRTLQTEDGSAEQHPSAVTGQTELQGRSADGADTIPRTEPRNPKLEEPLEAGGVGSSADGRGEAVQAAALKEDVPGVKTEEAVKEEDDIARARGSKSDSGTGKADSKSNVASKEQEKDRLVAIMEMLFARRDQRNVPRAVRDLQELAAELGPRGSSFPRWRPAAFPSDGELSDQVSGFATAPDGTVDLGQGWVLVRVHGPGTGTWVLQKKHKPPKYIFGNTKETLEYYGLGAGAPSPEVEYSGVAPDSGPEAGPITAGRGLVETSESIGATGATEALASEELPGGEDENEIESELNGAPPVSGSPDGDKGSDGADSEAGEPGLQGSSAAKDGTSETETEDMAAFVANSQPQNATSAEASEQPSPAAGANSRQQDLAYESEYDDLEEEEFPVPEKGGWKFGPAGWTYTGSDTAKVDMEAAASDALFLLGVLSATGLAPDVYPRNDTRAVEELSRAADTGSLQAILALAGRYMQGHGVEKNCRAALWYMKTVADRVLDDTVKSGDYALPKEPFRVRDWLRDGDYMVDGNLEDNPEQVDLDEDQALHGVTAYQRHLGYRRLLGRGLERDVQLAYRHFEAAAGAGDEVAAFNLGYMHMNGLSTPVNHSVAAKFFKTAAAKNLPAAFNGLGVLHFNGWGTAVNYTQARLYFLQGAARNDSDSLYNLGLIYTEGHDVPKDPPMGLRFFEKAALRGHWRGPYTVGLLHAEGLGVPVNCTQAVRQLRLFISQRGSWQQELAQAALAYRDGDHWSALVRYSVVGEEGSALGMENAAHMLRRGEGFQGQQRYDMALELLLRAADLGSVPPLIDIGHLYLQGRVSDKNRSKAVEFFQRAGAAGHPEGLFSLALVYQQGTLVPQNFTKARELLKEALKLSVAEEVVPVVLALWWLNVHETAVNCWKFLTWSWFTVLRQLVGPLGHTAQKGQNWVWLLLAGWDTVLVLVLTTALIGLYRFRIASQRAAATAEADESAHPGAAADVDASTRGDASLGEPVGASGEGSRNLPGAAEGLGGSNRSPETGATSYGGEGNDRLHQRGGLRIGSTS